MRLSKHAISRAKQRLSVCKKDLLRLAQKALLHGVTIEHVYGKLKKYVIKLYKNHRKRGKHIRVYEGVVYIFVADMLLTVIEIPESMGDYTLYIKSYRDDTD